MYYDNHTKKGRNELGVYCYKFLMLHLKQKLSFEDRLRVTKDVYCRH